jgi:hypothetical protein
MMMKTPESMHYNNACARRRLVGRRSRTVNGVSTKEYTSSMMHTSIIFALMNYNLVTLILSYRFPHSQQETVIRQYNDLC